MSIFYNRIKLLHVVISKKGNLKKKDLEMGGRIKI